VVLQLFAGWIFIDRFFVYAETHRMKNKQIRPPLLGGKKIVVMGGALVVILSVTYNLDQPLAHQSFSDVSKQQKTQAL